MANQQIRLGTIYLDFIARNARFVSQLRQSANAMRRQQRAIRALRRDIRAFNRSARAMLANLISLRGGLAGLLGIGGIFGLVRAFTSLSDIMQLAEARVKVIATSTDDFRAAMHGLFQISQETRTPLDSLVDLYARVGRAVQHLGFNHQQILPFIRSVSQAIIVSGATAQEARAGLIQFAQGLAVGAFRGDEFRSVAEQLPRVMLAIAEGIGTTLGPLRRFALDFGALSPELIINAIARSARDIDAEFRTIPRTVSQALTQVRNQLLFTVNAVNLTAGSTRTLGAALDRIRAVIADPRVVSGLVATLAELVTVAAALIENFRAVSHVFQVLFVAAIAQSGIGRFVKNLAVVVFTTGAWRTVLASTAVTFRRTFDSGPLATFTRGLRRLRRLSAVTFTRFIRSTRLGRVNLRAFGATLVLVGRNMLSFRAYAVGAGLALRTVFAGGVAAVTLGLRALRAVLLTLRALGRAVAFIAIVEGIILLIRTIFTLRRNMDELRTSFKNVAIVAGADFVNYLGRQLAKIPGLIYDVVILGKDAAVRAARSVGSIIGEALIPGLASRRAREAAAARPSDKEIQDRLLGPFGLSSEEVLRARSALRVTKEELEREYKALFGGGALDRSLLEDAFSGGAGVSGNIDLVKALREANKATQADAARLFRRIDRQVLSIRRTAREQIKSAEIQKRSLGLSQAEAAALQFRAQGEEALNRIIEERQSAIASAEYALAQNRKELAAAQRLLDEGKADLVVFSKAQKNVEDAEERLRVLKLILASLEEDFAGFYDDLDRDTREFQARQEELFNAQRLQEAVDLGKSAFEDLGDAAVFEFDRIGEAARKLAHQLARDLFRLLFLRPIANALGGAASGFLGINQAQHGGYHSGLTLVGERGPEIVDFRSPARVTSADDIRAAARLGGNGGASVEIIYAPVIESDNEAAVERALARALPEFEETVKNSIGADLSRPSLLRRAARRR